MASGMNNNANNNLAARFEREVVYRECRRNHAASLGKVACDGCCEFLGGGRNDDNAARDDLLCAACNCHRNFHCQYTIRIPILPQQPSQGAPHHNNSITTIDLNKTDAAMLMNGANNNNKAMTPPMLQLEMAAPRRKKWTAFSAEQKSRMMRFAAERLGWKPKKDDKQEIERFCLEMGITRRVFLVWVTNNRRKAVKNDNNITAPQN